MSDYLITVALQHFCKVASRVFWSLAIFPCRFFSRGTRTAGRVWVPLGDFGIGRVLPSSLMYIHSSFHNLSNSKNHTVKTLLVDIIYYYTCHGLSKLSPFYWIDNSFKTMSGEHRIHSIGQVPREKWPQEEEHERSLHQNYNALRSSTDDDVNDNIMLFIIKGTTERAPIEQPSITAPPLTIFRRRRRQRCSKSGKMKVIATKQAMNLV